MAQAAKKRCTRPLRWREAFPYTEAREIQAEALAEMERVWGDYDVFVVRAPTAFGKTAVARCIATATHSCSIITPNNMLVNQFLDEFPDTPTLHRLDSYKCPVWNRSCAATRGRCKAFCNTRNSGHQCKASRALTTARMRRGPGVYNYHTYLAHRIYRDVLVVDEAHNLIPIIRDRLSERLWQHVYRYPDSMSTPEQCKQWVRTLTPAQRKHKQVVHLVEALTHEAPAYVVTHTLEEFNGAGTRRGEPEERPCIRLIPVDISDAPPLFWPAGVEKIVLLSATIGPPDIATLGLDRKRVVYLDCASPIPVERRPVVPLSTALLSFESLLDPSTVEKLVAELEGIAEYHSEERGVVHATYSLANQLRGKLSERFVFHTRENKRTQYERFRAATDTRILVCSGMYEGIDLPGDLGRFQVVAKVPWPSLGSPAIRYLSEENPGWYLWETAKSMVQACGRVCRTPDDYGVTYILDSSFERLLRECGEIPEWFRDAIQQ